MKYDYECQNIECGLILEIDQGIKEPKITKCPICEQETFERIFLQAPLGFVKEVKTVGQLAEKNAKAMGRYGLEEAKRLEKENKISKDEAIKQKLRQRFPNAKIPEANKEKPWYGKLPDNLKNADSKRLDKYIIEGK